ncbi:MAG: serine/threonine protein kinase [Solirubrobacterales bacterium]|nr:serine/threonine protein kinase [Solirubrobacterales bacterium]
MQRATQFERGSLFSGYRIDEVIGRGGMGIVYRATHVALHRIYALKVLAPELVEDERFRDRFKREIRMAASLRHPNVVGIHYAGEHDGLLFLAMDYVHGTDLREILKKGGALPPERAVDLLAQAASAIDAAHGRGLIHRDVKPANILITVQEGEEHAYLTDFGVAKRFDTVADLTGTGVVVGTVDYMAPEQITGSRIDARTDVYALGCVFFQMLSGHVPYERDNSVAKLFAHVSNPPPPLQGGLAEQYPTFGPVLETAMAKEPRDRYLSAGDFARDAAAALHGMRYSGPATVVAVGDAKPSETIPGAAPSVAGTGMLEALRRTVADEAPPPTPRWEQPPPAYAQPPSASPAETGPRAQPPATVVSRSGADQPAAPPATAAATGAPSRPPPRPPSTKRTRLKWLYAAALLMVAIAGGAAAAVIASSGSSKSGGPGNQLNALTINHVHGSGTATVVFRGNTASIVVQTSGLLNAPHLMHIHAGGQGRCPPLSSPASVVSSFAGHRFISTTDGYKYYGSPVVALTKSGVSTDPNTPTGNYLNFASAPSGSSFTYKRTITLSGKVANEIRRSGVVVVHGISYDGRIVYDDYLGQSELTPQLTAEETAPALCGALRRSTAPSPPPSAAGEIKPAPATPQRSKEPVYTASLTVYRSLPMWWCGPINGQ